MPQGEPVAVIDKAGQRIRRAAAAVALDAPSRSETRSVLQRPDPAPAPIPGIAPIPAFVLNEVGPGPMAAGVPGAALGGSRVSVIIPTLNEAENLPYVLPRIPPWVDEVLLVDGLSTDGTVEIARHMRPDLVVVTQPTPGKGAALSAGFAAATGDIIVTLDADGSADPREIVAYVGVLLAGADYAKGSRFLQGGCTDDMDWFRRAGNWGLRVLARMLFGGRYSDLCYGYNAFWRHSLEQMNLVNSSGFEIETKMNLDVLAAGLRVVEVPSQEYRRIHGKSHLRSIPDGWRVLCTILRARLAKGRLATTAPPHLRHGGSADADAMEKMIGAPRA